jgi:L-iditol 2-dehydrogenase
MTAASTNTSQDLPETMRAAVLTQARDISVRSVPTPTAREGDVLVRIASVGLCGSDVHFYEDGHVGDLSVEKPLILGHEASGTIVRVGNGVDPARIGERVSIEPQRPCRHCNFCLTGRYNLCESMQFFSAPPVDGAFAEYLAVPADFAYPISDAISDDAAGLIEPLSVAIAAVRKAGIVPGSRLLVSGAGPIGLLVAQAARAFGASQVVVSDPLAARREASAEHGATRTLDPAREQPEEKSVDAYIDASGVAAAVTAGMRALRPGGRCVLVGMGSPTFPIDVFLVQSRELAIEGLFRYVDTWPTAIELVESGAVTLDSLVSERVPLARLAWAMEHNADANILKIIVQPWKKEQQ